ncbi:hypothetical protein DXG03_002049 [Asterophora parasitica]|uniref:C2H2-type domain-containing protein n=1 Tax=Asterophora parasitica TaxID=117018 RepID=A0A9P7G646_9AGAR|nr:hypothetical protein DXG03_002049 [Asterophora parasitica]
MTSHTQADLYALIPPVYAYRNASHENETFTGGDGHSSTVELQWSEGEIAGTNRPHEVASELDLWSIFIEEAVFLGSEEGASEKDGPDGSNQQNVWDFDYYAPLPFLDDFPGFDDELPPSLSPQPQQHLHFKFKGNIAYPTIPTPAFDHATQHHVFEDSTRTNMQDDATTHLPMTSSASSIPSKYAPMPPTPDVDIEYLPAHRQEDEFVKAGVHCRTLFQCAWANCTTGGSIALSKSADDATYQRNIQAHLKFHNKGIRGSESFTCTLDGCTSVIRGAKEFKRHLRSAVHLSYFRHYCPNLGCDKFYSRVDQVNKHLRKCRWSAGGENVPVVTLKRGREEPEDSEDGFVHWNGLEHLPGKRQKTN